MAYPHIQYQVMMTTSGVSATTSGDKAEWHCGLVPHIVRKVGIVYTTSGVDGTAASFKFYQISLASGASATTFQTLVGVATDKSGHVIYKSDLNVTVNPGSKVVFNVPAIVSGACNVVPFLWVEPAWERLANVTNARVTT